MGKPLKLKLWKHNECIVTEKLSRGEIWTEVNLEAQLASLSNKYMY